MVEELLVELSSRAWVATIDASSAEQDAVRATNVWLAEPGGSPRRYELFAEAQDAARRAAETTAARSKLVSALELVHDIVEASR